MQKPLTEEILDETHAGTHGRVNFFNAEDNAMTRATKYFNTKYKKPSREDMAKILEENPYNRSGVLIQTPDFHYSIDSFRIALNNLAKNIRQGRRYHPLKVDREYSLANDYGQAARYNEDFTPEFQTLVKNSNGSIPEGIKTFMKKDGTLIFQQADGKVVGKLIPRSNSEIINEYNQMIHNMNQRYGLNIKNARLNDKGQIEWPNEYGVLYRKGGNINSKNRTITINGQ